MNKLFVIAAICAACAAAAGCSANNAGAPVTMPETTVESSTAASTAAQNIETTAEPAAETTQEETTLQITTAPETTEPETDSGDAEIKALLTKGRWILNRVYVDGELYEGNYYGSIISQTGAYMDFTDDGSFSCILGFVSCSGTYSVEGGEVRLHLTKTTDGTSKLIDTDQTKTIELDRENETIMFDFSDKSENVRNEFVLL